MVRSTAEKGADAVERLLVGVNPAGTEIGRIADLAIIDEQFGHLLRLVHVEIIGVIMDDPLDRLFFA